MCKIVRYWFACHHEFRLRHSKCGGTKHRKTQGGMAPACKSEPYLNLVFAVDCGPCQHQSFEVNWKRKLSMAQSFLEKLKENGFPGVQEVTALVEQLKDEFNTATWDTRILFPHAHKGRAVRVSLGHFEKTPSSLRKEVFPEDIPDPSEVVGPDHPDYEYDWDYVASTDPIHPVDVNYAHPLDDVDPSWMLNHLSPEEFEQCGDGTAFDANEADAAWGNEVKEGFSLDQAPKIPTANASPNVEANTCAEDERLMPERIELVIDEFWRLVSSRNLHEEELQQAFSADLYDCLHTLHISNLLGDSTLFQTGLLTPPQTHARLFLDEPYDTQPLLQDGDHQPQHHP